MKKLLVCLVLVAVAVMPYAGFAATTQKVALNGWIPDWKQDDGVADVLPHIHEFASLSPFAFRVNAQGNLLGLTNLTQQPWTDLYVVAHTPKSTRKKTKIIPAVLWGDKDIMFDILSHASSRRGHIEQITKSILKNKNFDGVDIDYEGKTPETRDYFSLFLRQLHVKTKVLHKTMVCTIEPPPIFDPDQEATNENAYASIDESNDYRAIGTACDIVRVMTYDQAATSIHLNPVRMSPDYYAPVADPSWVTQVIKQTLKYIPARKVQLGVATYGYLYELTPITDSAQGTGFSYKRISALDYTAAADLAAKHNTSLTRNLAGELSASYPSDTAGKTRLIWISDSQAIGDKTKLARKYHLNGVVVFKLDGDHDDNFWGLVATRALQGKH